MMHTLNLKRLLSKFEIDRLECQTPEVRIPNAMYATTAPELTVELSTSNFHTNIIFLYIIRNSFF